MKKNTFLTICLSLFLAGGLFSQTTWYVTAGSNGGSNETGDGSVALPFATPFKAHASAAAGDIIIIDGEVIQPGTINVTKSLTFTGINNAAIIDNTGALQGRVFNINANDVSLTFNDLGFKNFEKKDASGVTVTGEIGVVLNTNGKTGVTLAFNNCIFVGNKSTTAGALFINGGTVATLTNCLFKENQAEKQGGALHIIESNVTMTRCTFYKNKTTSTTGNLNAGVMFVNGATSTVSIDYCTFYQNTTGAANQDYGAIRTDNGNTTVTNSLFYDNKTNNDTSPASDWGAGPSGTQEFTYSIGEWISGNVDTRTNFISFVKTNTNPLEVAADLTNSPLTWSPSLNNVTYTAPNSLTDHTPIDFGDNKSDVGSWDSKINLFKGTTDSDWATGTNWSSTAVPTSLENVTLLSDSPALILGGSTTSTINNLSVNGSSSLTINSGGSLIVNGTSSGNVTYLRNLPTTNWYLISAPVNGEDMTDMRANNTFADGSGGGRIGFAPYLTSGNSWSYFTTSSSDALIAGIGYSTKLASSGDLSFTGTINTTDVSVAVANTGTGFNLIGNPFTSHLTSATFLTDNTANLVSQTLWVWNGSIYETKVTEESFVLAPGQGFFVRSSNGTNLNIAESYQASTGGVFQKSARTEVKLMMNDGTADRFAKMYYLDNATKGFDNGFDGETFGGVENSVDVFTNLVADNQGKKFQVQSLPISEMETMIVPVGVKAAAGKEITFTAEAMNLPGDSKVFLEDRETNTITRLDEANTSYKVTLNDALNGTGRFFLHTKASGVLSTDDVVLQNTSVYATSNNTLRVVGLPSGNANLKIFNILGKQVMQTSFSSTGVKEISLPKLSTGMYIIQLETATGKLNKKIVLE